MNQVSSGVTIVIIFIKIAPLLLSSICTALLTDQLLIALFVITILFLLFFEIIDELQLRHQKIFSDVKHMVPAFKARLRVAIKEQLKKNLILYV